VTAIERTQLLVDIRRIIREEFEAYQGNGDIDAGVDANVPDEIDLGDEIK
jgi:hypothetical protein